MSDLKPTNPKDRAASHRLDLSLFPDSARAYGALAFTEGDAKYGGYNWRVAVVSANTYIAACGRHLAKWYNGEECDPVTKVPHLANAIACIAVIIDAVVAGKLKDDRPPKAEIAKLINDFEAISKHLHEMYPHGPDRYTAVGEASLFTRESVADKCERLGLDTVSETIAWGGQT